MSPADNNPESSKFFPVPGGGTHHEHPAAGKVLIGSVDEPSIYVEAQYNPKELEIAKNVPWTKKPEANKSNQKSQESQGVHMEFTGAEGRSFSLELLFDCYETHDPKVQVNKVQNAVSMLEKLASVRKAPASKEEFKRPHRCLVVWGKVISMQCVIESLSVKYTMFSVEGIPLRATCVVKFKEAAVVSVAKKQK